MIWLTCLATIFPIPIKLEDETRSHVWFNKLGFAVPGISKCEFGCREHFAVRILLELVASKINA